jgi:hypothetical protein
MTQKLGIWLRWQCGRFFALTRALVLAQWSLAPDKKIGATACVKFPTFESFSV